MKLAWTISGTPPKSTSPNQSKALKICIMWRRNRVENCGRCPMKMTASVINKTNWIIVGRSNSLPSIKGTDHPAVDKKTNYRQKMTATRKVIAEPPQNKKLNSPQRWSKKPSKTITIATRTREQLVYDRLCIWGPRCTLKKLRKMLGLLCRSFGFGKVAGPNRSSTKEKRKMDYAGVVENCFMIMDTSMRAVLYKTIGMV